MYTLATHVYSLIIINKLQEKIFVIGCNIRTWYIEFFDLACF
jgi:hypothetical protein